MSGRLKMEYLFADRPNKPTVRPADYDMLCVDSHGSQIYGELLWPDGGFVARRPCVLLFHGYPGVARNDDLAFALRRIGCVVAVMHHRGAWGSQGSYLISNCVEDVVSVCRHVQSRAFCRQYRVDPDAVFLAGHSMGGNSVLQAARQLRGVRGLVLLAPYDPTWHLRVGNPMELLSLLRTGYILHSDGTGAILRDIQAHLADYPFENAFEWVKDQNLCLVLGTRDTITRHEMVLPLWERLKAHETPAVQRMFQLPAAHGLCGCRMAMIQAVAEFLETVCDRDCASPGNAAATLRSTPR